MAVYLATRTMKFSFPDRHQTHSISQPECYRMEIVCIFSDVKLLQPKPVLSAREIQWPISMAAHCTRRYFQEYQRGRIRLRSVPTFISVSRFITTFKILFKGNMWACNFWLFYLHHYLRCVNRPSNSLSSVIVVYRWLFNSKYLCWFQCPG